MSRESFVFAHLADAHVGAWARDPAVRAALRQSVLRALEVVEERDCEFLLVSGDLFHTPVPDPAEVAPVAAAFRRLTSQGRRVYVIYGSHDYLAHRTSWLDVLAETGIFLRAAPDPVQVEGSRFTLPFQVDEPTGVAVAGISGRSHGLDRSYYAAVDSERFRSHPGFKVFQFHAAVEEYLPEGLREHVSGIRRDDLPEGCDYYAGGHIHYSYTGEGPGGGLLVNPGAVFGTSVADVENGLRGRTHQGLVVVTVREGVPEPEFVDTAPVHILKVFDIDVTGANPEEARARVSETMADHGKSGAILFPRLVGVTPGGSAEALGLAETSRALRAAGVNGIHWEISEESPLGATRPTSEASETGLIDSEMKLLLARPESRLPELEGPETEARLRELLRELGRPISEGEGRQDYETGRVDAALRILGVRPAPAP